VPDESIRPKSVEEKKERFWQMQRDRLQSYRALCEEYGHAAAVERLLEGYPERQRQLMGPLITDVPLAEGMTRAMSLFAEIGIVEDVVDISTEEVDAALELLVTCMCRRCGQDGGAADVPILCELDFEASRRAFPELEIEPLRRQVDGHPVCVFRYSRASRYSRPARLAPDGSEGHRADGSD
jgi:predicted ArsR family transcriptional regulator